MAQYEPQLPPPADIMPAQPRKWPLAAVMVIDLVFTIIVALVVATVVASILIGIHAIQQGIPLQNGLSQAQMLKLLGADGTFVVLIIQNSFFMLIPILRIWLIRRDPLAQIGFTAPQPLHLILLGIGMAVVMFVGSFGFNLIFENLGIRQNQAEQLVEQFSLSSDNTIGQALFLIGGGLLAPIGEETLFRGYVFNALRQTFGTKQWGIPAAYILSSLVFSLVHITGATEGIIALLVPIFFIALVLAWGMHRTGSLLPCIIAHALFNSIQLIAQVYCINTNQCANF